MGYCGFRPLSFEGITDWRKQVSIKQLAKAYTRWGFIQPFAAAIEGSYKQSNTRLGFCSNFPAPHWQFQRESTCKPSHPLEWQHQLWPHLPWHSGLLSDRRIWLCIYVPSHSLRYPWLKANTAIPTSILTGSLQKRLLLPFYSMLLSSKAFYVCMCGII